MQGSVLAGQKYFATGLLEEIQRPFARFLSVLIRVHPWLTAPWSGFICFLFVRAALNWIHYEISHAFSEDVHGPDSCAGLRLKPSRR
jgi:hypothetical protein